MKNMAEAGRGTDRTGKTAAYGESDERGFVLVIVMIIVAALLLLGLAANRNTIIDIGIASNHGSNTNSFYAAEAAGEFLYNKLSYKLPDNQTTAAASTLSFLNGLTVPTMDGFNPPVYSITPVGLPVQRPASSSFAGLTAWVQRYQIKATAQSIGSGAKNTVTIDIDSQLIPIFQFLIFYNGDLELNPGATMSIGSTTQKGWIHTNSNFYTSPGATETIYSNITAVGEIRHSRKQGDTQSNGSGAVSIENASGGFNNLVNGSSTWNGSSWQANPNWSTTEAQWGNTVQNNVQPLTLPLGLEQQATPESILNQTGTGTMGEKASLVITDGVAKDKAGNALNSCYADANWKNSNGSQKIDTGCTSGTNHNSLSQSSFYDYREVKTANATNIDVAKFQATAAGQYLATASPSNGGEMGVLYVTSTSADTSSQFAAVRLTDGATLASPLTVASDRPAYIQGDYNTNKKAAAVMSDATTVLSNQWKDTYTSSTGLSNRDVTGSTTINVDIMTGNQDTSVQSNGSQGYGGGVHNLTRFLEDWTSQNFNFGGSLVCLWESQHAKGKYQNTGSYYNVPNRVFTFNPFNGAMPPGTPGVCIIRKGTWRHY